MHRVTPLYFDSLTEALECIRVQCLLPSSHEMTAPWGVSFGKLDPLQMHQHIESMGFTLPAGRLPSVQGSIVAILRGNCCLEVENCRIKLPLASGDMVFVTRKDPVILRDDWHTPVRMFHELLGPDHIRNFSGIHHGGGGAPTSFLCGAFQFAEEDDHPFLSALPPVIHIRGCESDVAPWLEITLKLLNDELHNLKPGSRGIVNHLAHILFVHAIRAHVASLPKDTSGNWFHALFDPNLAPALALMHLHPEESWTVAELAEHACISRSSFFAKFTAMVGCPPQQYLTEHRMRKARMFLRDTTLGVKVIAARVGYSNESAFSIAFKRLCGMSPAKYRQSKRSDAASD